MDLELLEQNSDKAAPQGNFLQNIGKKDKFRNISGGGGGGVFNI